MVCSEILGQAATLKLGHMQRPEMNPAPPKQGDALLFTPEKRFY